MKERIINYFVRLSKRGKFRTEQYIVMAFAALILAGALLLTLPFASRSGESCGFLTALFTATSATCVTGLVVVDTYLQWTGFGQVVILCLIQIGGLGFMTVVSVFFFLLHRKIGLQQRLIMAQGFGLNAVDGVVKLVQNVLRGTFLIELTGAVILALRFMQQFPFWQSLKLGIFHAVSAFCNAGFDILGFIQPGGNLIPYATDPIINLVIMALIVLGGLGFYVWIDVVRKKRFRNFSVHTKLVLVITACLIIGGAALVALFEWNNPATLGKMAAGDKIMASFFQSVTCRTAGFMTVDQAALTESSKAVSIILMLIGGSSGSTAGGIKTVTIGVLIMSVLASARGKSRVTVFGRTISGEQIRQATTITCLMLFLAVGGAIFMASSHGMHFLECLFETASALGTVGLSANLTPLLSSAARVLLIIFMFFGRVGIVTFSIGFLMGSQVNERFHYAETKVLIG